MTSSGRGGVDSIHCKIIVILVLYFGLFTHSFAYVRRRKSAILTTMVNQALARTLKPLLKRIQQTEAEIHKETPYP